MPLDFLTYPALTVREPYATFLMLGVKRVETRTWRPDESLIGGRVAIHAGRAFDSDEFFEMVSEIDADLVELHGLDDPGGYPRGKVLGTMRLDDVGQVVNVVSEDYVTVRFSDGRQDVARVDSFGNYGAGRYLWYFSDADVWEGGGIEAKGRLGIWTFRREVESAVW